MNTSCFEAAVFHSSRCLRYSNRVVSATTRHLRIQHRKVEYVLGWQRQTMTSEGYRKLANISPFERVKCPSMRMSSLKCVVRDSVEENRGFVVVAFADLSPADNTFPFVASAEWSLYKVDDCTCCAFASRDSVDSQPLAVHEALTRCKHLRLVSVDTSVQKHSLILRDYTMPILDHTQKKDAQALLQCQPEVNTRKKKTKYFQILSDVIINVKCLTFALLLS